MLSVLAIGAWATSTTERRQDAAGRGINGIAASFILASGT